jgi:GNAT superfamily N-acetyltransferase
MPELRRQGRGRILLEYVRRFEPSDDCTWLECRIQQDWRAGEAFLDREGFLPWGTWISLKYRPNAEPLVGPIPGYSLKRLAPCAEVFRELERIARESHGVEVHQSADDFRRQFETGMTFLALQDAAGRIVGFGAYEHEQGQCYWIDNLVVDPGLHRIGLGRWLLASILSGLEGSPPTVALQCKATATGALALYSSSGFVEDGRSTMFRGARRKY